VATVTETTPAAPKPEAEIVPELENGDHLTRDEFERRYDAMPNLKRAELIEGIVNIPSPSRQRRNSRPRVHVCGWIGHYVAFTPGLEAGANGHVRLDFDNMPQPDSILFIESERGGQSRISNDDYIEGAPELVAEVATSSVSHDMGTNLQVYRRNGVREYVVWRVVDRQVDWFVLREGRFELPAPPADGIYRSTVFPGLWLDTSALVGGDLARVMAVVNDGIRSPEHADFVSRLNRSQA
jgi:Uma2 family endonuclease